jgi:hypothetical protein
MPTTITELAILRNPMIRQVIAATAIKHLREEHDVDTKEGVIQFDAEPQFNEEDKSLTYDVTVTIGEKLFELEVYATQDGKYEADCWRTNGKPNMVLELHK